jgi:hypothetical protein
MSFEKHMKIMASREYYYLAREKGKEFMCVYKLIKKYMKNVN